MESTLLYVVAYDISDNKRRTKIHKVLKGFGRWTQYSLFECFLTRKQLLLLQQKLKPHLQQPPPAGLGEAVLLLLQQKLKPHLRPAQDSVRFYPMCEACVRKVETVGGDVPKEEVVYIT